MTEGLKIPTLERWLKPDTERHVRINRFIEPGTSPMEPAEALWKIDLYPTEESSECSDNYGYGATLEIAFENAYRDMLSEVS